MTIDNTTITGEQLTQSPYLHTLVRKEGEIYE